MRYILGVFIVLHGMVHLLYFGQSARYFELKPGMVWPDGSWAFSRLLGNEAARNLASILLILAAMGLIVGGVGLLVNQAWWRPVVVGGAALSSLVYILFWNGSNAESGWSGVELAFSSTWQFCLQYSYFDGPPLNEIT